MSDVKIIIDELVREKYPAPISSEDLEEIEYLKKIYTAKFGKDKVFTALVLLRARGNKMLELSAQEKLI